MTDIELASASISIPLTSKIANERSGKCFLKVPTSTKEMFPYRCCNRLFESYDDILQHYDISHAPNGIIIGDPYPLSPTIQQERHQMLLQLAIALSPATDKLLSEGPAFPSAPLDIYSAPIIPQQLSQMDVDAALSILLQSQTALSQDTAYASKALHKRTLDSASFSLGSFLNNETKRFHEDNEIVVDCPPPHLLSASRVNGGDAIDDLERMLMSSLSFEDRASAAPVIIQHPLSVDTNAVVIESFQKQDILSPLSPTSQIDEVAAVTDLLSAIDRPFKCPHIDCRKSYKNRNGVKYHLAHGHLTPEEVDDLRKYSCRYEGCEKRYRNYNGIKYHLTHAHKGYYDVEKELKEIKEIAVQALCLLQNDVLGVEVAG